MLYPTRQSSITTCASSNEPNRLVDLYTNGRFEMALLDEKSAALADRRRALEKERMRLIAEAGPGCDPATLRERMPEVFAFIREWVRRADGDKLQLLLEALRVSIKATRGEVEIRVEVPLIKAVRKETLCHH